MQAEMVSNVLKSMCATGPEAWGMPFGIGEFAEILIRLDQQLDGFEGSDIALVEAAWDVGVQCDFAWDGGFVVALKDGRRAYISGDAKPIYDEKDQETYTLAWNHDVRLLGDEPYHSVTPLHPGPLNPWPWQEAPEHLNEFLRRLNAVS